MIFHPNCLKPKGQHLKFEHFRNISSFISHLEDVPSLLSQSTCSYPMEFICVNGIKDGIDDSIIVLTSFIITSISFRLRLDNICWSIFSIQYLRWRLTKFNSISNFFHFAFWENIAFSLSNENNFHRLRLVVSQWKLPLDEVL